MATITTAAATPARWDDVQRALTGGGDGKSCQCAWPVLTRAEWEASSVDDRTELLRAELAGAAPTSAGATAPGLVAYVDGTAAGWVRIGPRGSQRRFANSRIVKSGSREATTDPGVWAVTCFSVRREFRGLSLMSVLLDAAVGHARRHGARIVEASPIDLAVGAANANALYVGSLAVFERAGFEVVARPTKARVLVSLTL